MITKERLREMESRFWAEITGPESKEWREVLTAEEEALAAQWGAMLAAGLADKIDRIEEKFFDTVRRGI